VELRKRGVQIKVFSTRKCHQNQLLTDQDRDAFHETWSIIPTKIVPFMLSHVWGISTNPKFYFNALSTSLKHRLPGLKNAVWALFYFAEGIYLAREISRQNIQHIHVHFANSGAYIVKVASNFLNITWSMNLHGACDFEYPDGPMLREKIEKATFVNCASYYGRSQAMRTVSTEHWEKIFVSRCGIEIAQMEDPGKIRDKAEDAPIRVL
jgi:colanic acid/amylovoran biosynthesis glycosyltransferase